LLWATAYNLVTTPVAAGFFVHWELDLPMNVGAVAMSLSSIIVGANAQMAAEGPEFRTTAVSHFWGALHYTPVPGYSGRANPCDSADQNCPESSESSRIFCRRNSRKKNALCERKERLALPGRALMREKH